ncbi:MAG: 4-hydroxythreonine-4-phosphate dehydrogenase PdxA [Bacteroidetes bacterium]|nr:4-hydroxythreonine-4-phosphate dehydrogenase PdxA [Bacteroidota bacterium]
MNSKPAIAITIGDCNGIGPEIVLKSASDPMVRRICSPVLVGPADVFGFYAKRLRMRLPSCPIVESSTLPISQIRPGLVSAKSGKAAAQAIEAAVQLAEAGVVQAVVTAPVSKHALHRAHVRFPGHTEMLQHLTGAKRVAMMLVSETMRVGLVTIHVPIKRVSSIITRKLLRQRIEVIHTALLRDWRIKKPRIAVLALNPHAGEAGDIGTEDKRIIAPVVQHLASAKMNIKGPFPADAFFARNRHQDFDAVIAMYHDQGLIPLKMSAHGRAVNVTAGLPIVRTSPDHGTAFDIAGRGIADPGSMIEAIKLAVMIARNRQAVQSRS